MESGRGRLVAVSWQLRFYVAVTGCTWQSTSNAVVTPLRKAASYEPRIAILGIWVDTWLTRGKYGIYVAVRGSNGAP